MSSFSAIYVKTNQLDAVVQVIKGLTGLPVAQTTSFPKKFGVTFGSYFPTAVVIGLLQPEWITIEHNGGSDTEVWMSILSEDFNTQSIAIGGESVSSYYELILYDKGQKIRHIRYVCDDDDSLSFSWGEKLAFENEDNSLNPQRMEEFCANLGLKVSHNYADYQWVTLTKEHFMVVDIPKQSFWEKLLQFFNNKS